MTKISSDHKNEIQFFRNHLPRPWILKINESTPLCMEVLVLSSICSCAVAIATLCSQKVNTKRELQRKDYSLIHYLSISY